MSAIVRTPECFPHRLPFTRNAEHPPLGHSKCQGGFSLDGLIGGWRCACRCHSTPKPAELPGYGCDWGDCMEDAVGFRWADEHGWLPVCVKHGHEGTPLEVES